MKAEEKKDEIVIDATNALVGRIASYAAKQSLLGKKVKIINSELAVISGDKRFTFEKYKKVVDRGTPRKGVFISRLPDRFLKRIIRGMLPYKKERGRNAFKNIRCFIGNPENLRGVVVKGSECTANKYISVGKLCRLLGWKR